MFGSANQPQCQRPRLHATLLIEFAELRYGGRPAAVLRGSLRDTMQMDYVRTARAKGIGEAGVLLRHALRNAAVPVITVIGLQVGAIIAYLKELN